MKKLVAVVLLTVFCSVNMTSTFAANIEENYEQRGNEISSNQEIICDDHSRSSIKVTESDVFYGWQLFAEGRLLCIEGYVTAKARHYTRTTMQKKTTGAVYAKAYAVGTNKVEANKYNIKPPKKPESYEGRVHYGAA